MKKFVADHKVLVILSLVVMVFAVYYAVCQAMALNRYAGQFEKQFQREEVFGKDSVDLYQVPGYHDLLKQKGLLRSLISLAQEDSIGLYLNLPDSIAGLMIKGVMVRSIPLRELRMSGLFARASDEALYEWLSEPLQIVGSVATIPHEPVNIVVAPSDSSEEAPALVPDTLYKDPVFFILETDRDLRLYFYQTEQENSWARMKFFGCDKWQEAMLAIKQMVGLKLPKYTPALHIGLSREDAQVLYRALPQHGRIVITL